jgi:hypothetical protein
VTGETVKRACRILLSIVLLCAVSSPAFASGPRVDGDMYQEVIDARTRGREAFRKAQAGEEERAAEASRLRRAEFDHERAVRGLAGRSKEEPEEEDGFPWVVVLYGFAAAVGVFALRRRRSS